MFQKGVLALSPEGAAIVAGGRNIGIKRFAKAVRPGIGEAREARRNHDRERREAEHRQGQDENGEDRHFDFFRLELFAEIFRGAADHEPSDEARRSRRAAFHKGPSQRRRR